LLSWAWIQKIDPVSQDQTSQFMKGARLMSKWIKIGIVGFLVVGAVTALVAGAALAQVETPTAPLVPDNSVPHGRGGGMGWGMGSQVELEAAAKALGMTADELKTQLWGGKTLADLAEEKGIDLADVQAAIEAAQEAAMRENIAQAVEDGTITQEHADWLLEGLEKGFLTDGFGLGHGFGGGFHGRGFQFFNQPDSAPQATPSPNS
jgi:hypothetical protein